MSDMINGYRPLPSPLFKTAGLISHLSIADLFTKPLELLIHGFGSPKFEVASVSECSDIFAISCLPSAGRVLF